tara:strand:+ start:1472 stop:1864 length:393 start_codon:yes stop_codon:yes gene_type:complete
MSSYHNIACRGGALVVFQERPHTPTQVVVPPTPDSRARFGPFAVASVFSQTAGGDLFAAQVRLRAKRKYRVPMHSFYLRPLRYLRKRKATIVINKRGNLAHWLFTTHCTHETHTTRETSGQESTRAEWPG